MDFVSPAGAGALLPGTPRQSIPAKIVKKYKYLLQLELVPVQGLQWPWGECDRHPQPLTGDREVTGGQHSAHFVVEIGTKHSTDSLEQIKQHF